MSGLINGIGSDGYIFSLANIRNLKAKKLKTTTSNKIAKRTVFEVEDIITKRNKPIGNYINSELKRFYDLPMINFLAIV